MLKRVVFLLLFVQFSFGQDNESSLELDTEGRLSLGIKYSHSSPKYLGYSLSTDYFFKNSLIGLEIGNKFSNVKELNERIRLTLYSLRYGINIVPSTKVIFTYGISTDERMDGVNYNGLKLNEFHIVGIGLIFNDTNQFQQEIQFQSLSNTDYSVVGKMSSSYLSFGLNYKLLPSKKKAIKKLTQAKNALDLELITQKEYEKIYVKYAHFTKDKE